MKPHELRKAIEDLLRQHSDGLTTLEMSKRLGLGKRQVAYRLTVMNTVYIDRWARLGNVGGAVAIWCLGSEKHTPRIAPQTPEERRAAKAEWCRKSRRSKRNETQV